MHDVIVKCASDASLGIPLLMAIVTIIFTSPLLLSGSNTILAAFERRTRFPEWAAVFLTNGQVYFGKVGKLTPTDLRLEHIYYLNARDYEQDKKTNKELSLIKLGEELHGPQDFMLINRQHIIYLESLSPDGTVVEAIKTYETQNPTS